MNTGAEKFFIEKHYAMAGGMLPFSLVISLMEDFADQQNKELSQENLDLKKQNTELAKILRKSVKIVKQMDADVSGISTDLEKDLFVLVNKYAKAGLSKPHIVARLEWVLGSVKKRKPIRNENKI
ncbi:MAG: hypothetical protein IID16_00910 [Candidatus Marinimicrobia bacterium]|nr:hypothetical protein [Candidatus Neomarinimicrobiota bacterium]